MPVGGETSVHTHPGPELIYQLRGRIYYQNALIGTKLMGPGDVEGIPPLTGVQKRNLYTEDAEFLSWFLVDASQPFASPALFNTSTDRGENLASSAQGARIVGVSSNYAGARTIRHSAQTRHWMAIPPPLGLLMGMVTMPGWKSNSPRKPPLLHWDYGPELWALRRR